MIMRLSLGDNLTHFLSIAYFFLSKKWLAVYRQKENREVRLFIQCQIASEWQS